MKFGRPIQQRISNWMSLTWPNMKFFRIQDGGRPTYLKSFLAITQQPIVRFQWNSTWGSWEVDAKAISIAIAPWRN